MLMHGQTLIETEPIDLRIILCALDIFDIATA